MKVKKPTHKIPSGMGGSFEVSILKMNSIQAAVEIYYPGGDFHGTFQVVNREDLTPLDKKAATNRQS